MTKIAEVHIYRMTNEELQALVDGDNQDLQFAAEEELWKRIDAQQDSRVAQGTGNAHGEFPS